MDQNRASKENDAAFEQKAPKSKDGCEKKEPHLEHPDSQREHKREKVSDSVWRRLQCLKDLRQEKSEDRGAIFIDGVRMIPRKWNLSLLSVLGKGTKEGEIMLGSRSKDARSPHRPSASISRVVVKCISELNRLCYEEALQKQPDMLPEFWQDELGRLRVWAANIGSHQTGQSSLEHRLREASHIKDQTLRLLERLQRAIQDLEDALNGSESEDNFLDSDERSENEETDLQSIYHALRDTIDNLFQMSMLIRRPAQQDRLLGTRRSDAAIFEPFDQQHVQSKYPKAEEFVMHRLGLANSQRRAVIRYRKRHHMKLAQGLDRAIKDQLDNLPTMISDTVATDFEKISEKHTKFEYESVATETSYAQTVLHRGEGITLQPPPKASADGAPFECPYCFLIISVTNQRAWARHVLNDLMPYVCMFPECPTPHRLYESRREWFSHLRMEHCIVVDSNTNVDCPLCLSSVTSGMHFERHVGRHLEELALFALPRCHEDNDESLLAEIEADSKLKSTILDSALEFSFSESEGEKLSSPGSDFDLIPDSVRQRQYENVKASEAE